jgi:hypothetical protein
LLPSFDLLVTDLVVEEFVTDLFEEGFVTDLFEEGFVTVLFVVVVVTDLLVVVFAGFLFTELFLSVGGFADLFTSVDVLLLLLSDEELIPFLFVTLEFDLLDSEELIRAGLSDLLYWSGCFSANLASPALL